MGSPPYISFKRIVNGLVNRIKHVIVLLKFRGVGVLRTYPFLAPQSVYCYSNNIAKTFIYTFYMIEYTHDSAKEWFVFYHCQTPTQLGLNILKTTFCFSSDKKNERVKDKLRAEGFISIRDQPKHEREKIIFRERENWLLRNLFAGKRGNWL